MTELYIFGQDDQLLTVITESTGLVSAPFREELNKVSDTPFSFTVEADTEESQHVKEENQVVFKDKDGDLRLCVIKELDDSDGADGPETTAICEPAFMELKEHIIVDRRFTDKEAQVALDAALEGSRWAGEVEVSLGTYSTNFYYMTSIDAIWNILETWGGDFKDVVEFVEDTNQIKRRVIKLQQRRGVDRGQRFEIDHNITEIQRTVLSYPVTAMYGRGASLETEGGGYTRYLDFAEVEWKKENGDPVDKPKGKKWVGDPEALQEYGRVHEGKLLHREGIFSNQDYETAEELLQATWQALQEAKEPEVNYSLSVELLEHLAGYEHEYVQLGDTSRAIDRNFSRPIEIQARIIAMEYDLVDIEGTATVEMGQFLSVNSDNRLQRVIETIDGNRGKWEHISNDHFPDVVPAVPSNIKAEGLFKSILLQWDYTGEIYIKHYEVYGSQVQGFVPQPQHLLYRGNVSSFSHAVETEQKWYYRVRAANHQERASDYSQEVSASTLRVISDDILFGEDIAAQLRELSMTAQLLADGSINFEQISETAREQIKQDSTKYTDEQITTARNALIQNIAAKADLEFVNGKFKFSDEKLQELDGEIVELTNKTIAYNQDFVEVKQSVDDVKGSIETTIQQVNGIDDTVKDQQLQIKQNAKGISSKVSTDTYQQDAATINRRFENVNSEFSQQAGLIQQRVTETKYNEGISGLRQAIEGIEIGGTNLIRNSRYFKNVEGWVGSTQMPVSVTANGNLLVEIITPVTAHHFWTKITEDIEKGVPYTLTMKARSSDIGSPSFVLADSNGGVFFDSMNVPDFSQPDVFEILTSQFTPVNDGDLTLATSSTGRPDGWYLEIEWIKLERANKPSAWSAAPEDYLDRFVRNESDIKQQAGLISQKVSQTVYKTDQDKVVEQLADHTSLIEQTAKKIESKVESSTFNNLQQTVSEQAATIEQQAGLIRQKVDSSMFNNLKGTVESHTSQIKQQATQISQRITSTELKSAIDSVTKKYITSGTGSSNYGKWTKIFDLDIYNRYSWVSLDFSFIGGADGGSKTRYGTGFARLKQQNSMGSPPLCQLEIRESTGISENDFVYVVTQNDSSKTVMTVYMKISNSYESYYISPVSIAGQTTPNFYENTGFVSPVPGDYVWAKRNLVAGDTENINGVPSGEVTQRLSTAESEIKQQADNIELRVRKDGIVAALNVSSEGIRIDGRLHHITGTTLIDRSVIKAAHIANAAVGNAAIANAAITKAKIGTAAIGTAQIENGAITNAKIANLAVDDAKIASLSVNKLRAGTLDANKIKIRGGSSVDYMDIQGSNLESRGRYSMRWKNRSSTIDASLYLANGNFRVANWTDERSIFLTPYGLSTFADGYGDGTSSGMLEFFSEEYESNTHGITLGSQYGITGVKSANNSVIIDSHASARIESRISPVYIRAGHGLQPYDMTFAFTPSSDSADSYLMYGNTGAPNVGLRFYRGDGDPRIAVVDRNYARGGNTWFDVGNISANSIDKRDGSASVYWNGTGGGTLLTTNPQTPLMADGVRGTAEYFYIGSDGGTKITNGAGYNYGRGLVHKPIWASAFNQVSLIEYKTNIERLSVDALDLINSTTLTKYNLKADLEEGHIVDKVGLIIGGDYSTPKEVINPDGDAIDQYAMNTLSWKAIQELSSEYESAAKEINFLRLRVSTLEQQIQDLKNNAA
ncbi:phage tail protein [Terribacillus sp. DMT04]|uniref:phage tail protein n=1 Tax=Terribacillus sp. DMT04 TaxID=2850441 RepID=UPI001C2B92DE|nr:phage tail protein [Terribacillus sp. DMT04]QXE02776.1 phage tail protein [Terribacillus sp. DMT04]